MQLDINQIKEILPHRYPFLMVDRIVDMEPGKYADGIKNVTVNEMHFLGHFPEHPVMPGVLILEALAQTGGCAILSEEEFKGRLPIFGGVKNCRFRREVIPGDVLELHCEITGRKGPIGMGKGTAKVNGEIACEAEISFFIK